MNIAALGDHVTLAVALQKIRVGKKEKKEIPYERAFEGHRVHNGYAVLSLNLGCEGVGINSINTSS